MKTELKIPEESKPESKFPLLATSRRNGFTVLFKAETSGSVLTANALFDVGHYSNDWVAVFEAGHWIIHPPGTQLILTVE